LTHSVEAANFDPKSWQEQSRNAKNNSTRIHERNLVAQTCIELLNTFDTLSFRVRMSTLLSTLSHKPPELLSPLRQYLVHIFSHTSYAKAAAAAAA
jgi:hypothetical protein